MKYRVHYWYNHLTDITGYEHGEEISLEQIMELITKREVNILILNNKESNTVGICPLGKRFQQC